MSNPDRRPPTLSRAAAVAALLAILLLAPPLSAQEAAPLYVDFGFGAYPELLLADPAAARREVVAGLVAAAAAKLPWRFEPATGDADYPRLAVRIEKRPGGDYELEATLLLAAGMEDGRWSGGFVSEQELEDLDGFPAPSRIPARVIERFDTEVLTPERVIPTGGDLFSRLRERVPLGRKAHLEPGDDRGMVGLDWSKHYRYSLSTFRTDCRNPQGDVVSLYSKGTGGAVSFPASPSFRAIVVQHDRWRQGATEENVAPDHLGQLGELEPQRVFLEEFDPRGLSLTPAEEGTVAPTLATTEGGGQ